MMTINFKYLDIIDFILTQNHNDEYQVQIFKYNLL